MKTILHFLNYDMTIKVGRPGVTMDESTYTAEQSIPLPRIALDGYYREVMVGDIKHLYYVGLEYEPIGPASRETSYKSSWTLTEDEEVFEY